MDARFRDGDWKERGLGDAKLLKHKVTGKVARPLLGLYYSTLYHIILLCYTVLSLWPPECEQLTAGGPKLHKRG